MQSQGQYPFRTLRIVDGEEYVKVSEVNEMLENLAKLGPTFQKIADATEKLRDVFADSKPKVDNLLVELKEAAGNN